MMPAFFRCTLANKATLFGYLGILIFAAHTTLVFCDFFPLHQYEWFSMALSAVYLFVVLFSSTFGIMLLVATSFGRESYTAYRRARDLIANGKMSYRTCQLFKHNDCAYAGYRVAMKEFWPSLKSYGRS
jgi:hypothetical protein